MRTCHINIRYYFVTDKIKSKEMHIEYCPTQSMIADFFTKPLKGPNSNYFVTSFSIQQNQLALLFITFQPPILSSPMKMVVASLNLPTTEVCWRKDPGLAYCHFLIPMTYHHKQARCCVTSAFEGCHKTQRTCQLAFDSGPDKPRAKQSNAH
jgi:hypothetical protein